MGETTMSQPWIVDLVEQARSLATERQTLLDYGSTLQCEVSGKCLFVLSPDNEFDSFLMALLIIDHGMKIKFEEEDERLQDEIFHHEQAEENELALQKTHHLDSLRESVSVVERIIWKTFREHPNVEVSSEEWRIGHGWSVFVSGVDTRMKNLLQGVTQMATDGADPTMP